MNALDIILGIPLLYAAYRGFREGIVLQLGGIIGLLAGVWLAFRYGEALGQWMRLEGTTAVVVGALCIVVATLLVIAVAGRLARGLCKLTGLGLFDQMGGLILSVAKMGLILSLLLLLFDGLNSEHRWVERRTMEKSLLYKPVKDISDFVFPYLDEVKERFVLSQENNGQRTKAPGANRGEQKGAGPTIAGNTVSERGTPAKNG